MVSVCVFVCLFDFKSLNGHQFRIICRIKQPESTLPWFVGTIFTAYLSCLIHIVIDSIYTSIAPILFIFKYKIIGLDSFDLLFLLVYLVISSPSKAQIFNKGLGYF